MKVMEEIKTGFFIGGLYIQSRILSAPLAGFSDRSFRHVIRTFGCHLVYTEMISADGLSRNNRQTLNLLDIEGETAPVAVQLFGNNPKTLSQAAQIVEDKGASIVDLNLGCPVRKVVRSGAGAALLNQPDTVIEIIRAIRKAVKIPFTVKMRKGTEDNPYAALELSPLLENEGVNAICLHPRTKEQLYAGEADWQQIAELKKRIQIPVIGNGDIRNGSDILRMANLTLCDGIMIGRAALGNPWIFQEARAALGEIEEKEAIPPSNMERIQTAIFHLEQMIYKKGEKRGLMEFRKHGMHYLKGLPFAKEMRSRFYQFNSFEQTKEFLTNTNLHLNS